MPVQSQFPINEYTASGSGTVFPYTFKVPNEDSMRVFVDDVLQSGGYVVSTIGSSSGGNVTFTVAPPADALIRLERSIPLIRETDYTEGGALPAQVLDNDFDKLTMIAQDLAATSLRAQGGSEIDAYGKRITNVGAPVDPTDAVTKEWVEEAGESFVAVTTVNANAALMAQHAAEDAADQAADFTGMTAGYMAATAGFRELAQEYAEAAEESATSIGDAETNSAASAAAAATSETNAAASAASAAADAASAANDAEIAYECGVATSIDSALALDAQEAAGASATSAGYSATTATTKANAAAVSETNAAASAAAAAASAAAAAASAEEAAGGGGGGTPDPNTAYINVAQTFAGVQTFSGQVSVAAGTVSAPAIRFSGDTDTGIYTSGTDSVDLVARGRRALRVRSPDTSNTNNTFISIDAYGGSAYPDIIVNSDATDKPLGIFSKGTASVNIGSQSGSKKNLYVGAYASATTSIELMGGTGRTFLISSADSGYTAANISVFQTGGLTTNSYHLFQHYNGTTDYDTLRVGPAATITGAQNHLAIYSTNASGVPSLAALGGDTNIALRIGGKGTGALQLNGTATTVSSTGAVATTQSVTASTFASGEYSAGSGAPGTINWNNGQNQTRTLTSSGSLTLSNPVNGTTYKLRIVQGGAGSFTVTWPTIKWAGGVAPTLSTAVGAEDIITLYYNGTSYYGHAVTGFA